MPHRRRRRRGALAVAAPAGLLALLLALAPAPGRLPAAGIVVRAAQAPSVEAEVKTVCGACHLVPPPDILPKHAWRDSVARMTLIRDQKPEIVGPPGTAARAVPLPPEMQRILAWYETRAPARLPAPEAWPAEQSGGFARHLIAPDGPVRLPHVSHVRLRDLDGDERPEVLVTDMRLGLVLLGRPYQPERPLEVLDALLNPAHVQVADFDRDGLDDLLVADLGKFLPGDHDRGSVVWMRRKPGGGYSTLTLDRWPRVADVEAADFNGDGRLDLAVAAFGWRQTGRLEVLENHTTDYDRPSFASRVVDPRPGAIHAIPVDLNGDGRMDLVSLLAQEHETVIAFLNQGTRETSFEAREIYRAPHPNWGSSGIEVVDLDGDGDLDVLLTHGDSFDDWIVKPYHGIQWLENTGSFPFKEHSLARIPGVHRARAADLDGDGDLDIVAGALLAAGADLDAASLPALVWLEQKGKGEFVRHTLKMGFPCHATLDVGDIDADGDVDIVVGRFSIEGCGPEGWVEVWENLRLNGRGSPAPTDHHEEEPARRRR